MNIKKWLNKNTKSLKGKTIAITGSTGGLGKEICQHVAKLGGDLILLDRNEKRSIQHSESLKQKFLIDVKTIVGDMVDVCSVKNLCEQLKKEKFDFLVLNAGAYSLPREKASLGYDKVFQINFISPYYIVKELLPYLREKKDVKVVVVGSIAHKYSKINENDIDFSKVKAPRKVYGNAKRFLMYSLSKLLEKEESITFSIAHPGITPTNITSHYSKFVQAIVKYPMKLAFTNPKNASLNIVKGLFENCSPKTWIGPRIFNIWGKPKIHALKTCDNGEREKIFEIAERLYGEMKE